MSMLKVNTLSDCNLSQDGLRCLLNQDWLPNSQLQELILTHTHTHTWSSTSASFKDTPEFIRLARELLVKPSRLIKPCYPIWSDNVPQSSIWYQAVCVSLRFGALLNNGEVHFIGKMEPWRCRCPTPSLWVWYTTVSLSLSSSSPYVHPSVTARNLRSADKRWPFFFHPEKSFGDTVLVLWHHIQ